MYTHRLTQHGKAVILQLNIHTYIYMDVCMYQGREAPSATGKRNYKVELKTYG